MINIAQKKKEAFTEFLVSVDKDLGRDKDSINLFEWVIEDRYDAEISDNNDYFAERPDLLNIQNEQILFEMDQMLNHFEYLEEYEKCSSIVKLKEEFKAKL